jgi:hypothetical protein
MNTNYRHGGKCVRLGVVIAALVLAALALPAASSDCDRTCEVVAQGYKELAPGTFKKMRGLDIPVSRAKDPTFHRGLFLEHFKSMFAGSRLKLGGPVADPEYILDATFSKFTEINTGKPYSVLTIALGFNWKSQLCIRWLCEDFSGDLKKPDFRKDKNCVPVHYRMPELANWVSVAEGHDIASHVPSMRGQISASQINSLLTAYEQIPVSGELQEDKPYWCDEPPQRQTFKIGVKKFSAAADAAPSAQCIHYVRIVVRAEKGKIENGSRSNLDDKARVFKVSASKISSGLTEVMKYMPPSGEDMSDTITVYNSCEIRPEEAVPLGDTEKKDKLIEIENECGWEGTLSMKESMAAGEKESALASLMPGSEYDLSKNWAIDFKLKRKESKGNMTRYEVEEATLEAFKDTMDATLTKMEREGRRIESKTKESAKAGGRRLGKGECDLELVIDSKEGTYSLEGGIDVKGIKITGRDEMDIKVKPVNKEIDENAGGTTGIDEGVEISGEFPPGEPPCVPEELKGSKDLMDEVAPEFREFMEALGGKQSHVMRWELKRKAVKITQY